MSLQAMARDVPGKRLVVAPLECRLNLAAGVVCSTRIVISGEFMGRT